MVVLCIAVSGSMLGMSGFYDAWGAPAPQTDAAQDRLNDSAADVNPSGGAVSGPVSSSEGEIVGLIVNGLTSLTDAAGAVVLLPITLINLGFPVWFAMPVGGLATFLAGVGIIQWVTNRVWR